MAGRTIAIGDIHGCSAALRAVLDAVVPTADDTLVFLGDYIDRGPDSRGVLDLVIDLAGRCRLVPLLGNHEEMMLGARAGREGLESWLRCGGVETVQSYGWVPGGPRRGLDGWVPEEHWRFLAGCRPYHETATHLFVHANYWPNAPMANQPATIRLWQPLDPEWVGPHCSGKVAVVGHTPQRGGEILDLGFLVCIDTNCQRGGWLTALDVASGTVWQADRDGQLRT